MLRRENDLRLCEETQEKFRSAASTFGSSGWIRIVLQLQDQVCDEFGLSKEIGLRALREAESLLPNDPEVKEISLYRKYNRCVDGNLNIHDSPPDVGLVHPTTKGIVQLHSIINFLRAPVVIFAGSYT